ncbi:MAG: ATP-binding cassette domain-containing protein [Candidatus Moranbacteria bacterium]|nr:ATP-binding cassette domain-containing protein [Candidatus Moranbacteria bacterium]
MPKQTIIDAHALEKTFITGEVKTHALRGVTFKINKGEFVAIMGPSGSGKSTLMQLLGFLDRPTSGKYFFEGQDASVFEDDDLAQIRNKKIGFVFQTFNLLPRTTVFENVEVPLLYDSNRKSKKRNRHLIERALKQVNMMYRIDYSSNQLSGGERQRVAIARALVNEPKVIFADEPTGNLDSKSGVQVMKILQQLNKEGKTVILVTHETRTAKHARRIIRLVDGKITSDAKVNHQLDANGIEELK